MNVDAGAISKAPLALRRIERQAVHTQLPPSHMSELLEQEATASSYPAAPADVSLMLRAHAELRCLSREVIPVLRQIETRSGLPDDQLGAALAYLEVMWMQARTHAAKTDAAGALLAAGRSEQAQGLSESALAYRTAVTVLRGAVAGRVAALLDAPAPPRAIAARLETAVNGHHSETRALLGDAGPDG